MVKEYRVDYVPGGATQNTIRIAQVCLIYIVFLETLAVYNLR
jgi:hypothetical protein